MARYPGAVWREVRRFRTPMRPVRVNLHTAVSNTSSLFAFFNRPGQVCSHFYVRKDGTVEQYVDTRYRAAADLDGNSDTISIETWDGYRTGAPGYWRHDSDVPPWTPAQVAALTGLIGWILRAHPTIPARLARNSIPGTSSHGVSWHRLGIDPWRQGAGLKYSNARGKVCPGDRRIAQIPGLLTSATSGAAGIGGPVPDVPDLTPPTPIAPRSWLDMATQQDVHDAVHRPLSVIRVPGTRAAYGCYPTARVHATAADLDRWGMGITDADVTDRRWWLPLAGKPGETYRKRGDDTGAVHTFEDGVLYHLTAQQWADIGKVGFLDLPVDHPLWTRPVRTR